MADIAEDKNTATDMKKDSANIEASTNGEQKIDTAPADQAKNEEVKTNGETHEEDSKQEHSDTAEDKQDKADQDSASGSKSPDNKRKTPPISAHERDDRNKRSRGGGRGRGGPRGGARFSSKIIKTRFDDLPESNDPDEIRRQVEFYFSDSNLPIDAYLLKQTGGHDNNPVPLKIIHNFKRMQHFQPFTAVRDAVKESDFLDLNDNDEITRKTPLDAKYTDDPQKNRSLVHTSSMTRSIYAKGFGDEVPSTHLDIEAFFAPYGPINSVRLRRSDDGGFKGSVFVEFEDDETQQRFLELDPKPQWNDKDLKIMSKQAYVDEKHQGIHEGLVKPKSPTRQPYNNRGGRGRGRGDKRHSSDRHDRDRRGSRDSIDKDDWKRRRDRDQRDERRDFRGRDKFRGPRRSSPKGRDDRKRRDSDEYEKREEAAKEDVKRAEVVGGADKDQDKVESETKAGAEDVKAGGEVVEEEITESKKRALEDDGESEGQGEAKKVKEAVEA